MAINNPELDLYMVLDIEKGASQKQIEDAYKLAKYEGELNIGDAGRGPARAGDIESAYAVLSDPASRAEYDKTLD